MGLEPGRTGLSTAIMHTGGYTHTSNGNTCMHATPTVHIMHTGACLEYLSIPPQVTEIRALQTEAVPGRRGEPESLAHWEARNSPERGGGTASFEFRKSGPTPQSDTTPQLSPSPSRVYSRASRNRRLFTGALRDLRHSMCCMRYSGRGGEGGGGDWLGFAAKRADVPASVSRQRAGAATDVTYVSPRIEHHSPAAKLRLDGPSSERTRMAVL